MSFSTQTRTSVLINNYNNGPWLRVCIDSVLNQTKPADEIIVYDDGSTDESLSILRAYDDRITLIEGIHDFDRHPRDSQVYGVYQAYLASTGAHIYFLDGDDLFLPEKIEAYEAAWERQPDAIMIQSPMTLVDGQGNFIKELRESHKHAPDHLKSIYRRQDSDLFYWTSALAIHRSVFEQIYPDIFVDKPPCHIAIDAIFGSLAPLFGPVVTLPKILTHWRRLPKSMGDRFTGTRLQNLRIRHKLFNIWATKLHTRRIHLWLCREFYHHILGNLGLRPIYRWIKRS